MTKTHKSFTPTLLSMLALIFVATLAFFSQTQKAIAEVVVYKSPTCGCCKKWVDHLEANGFQVSVHDRSDMSHIKQQFAVPRKLQSCHTAKVGNYVIEGHVPASEVKRLLQEKPEVAGLSVPGMPMGSPGMEGFRNDPYQVLIFDSNNIDVYANYPKR